ncbi:TetR/AcrR family transcriptional regulator [Nocardia cyriacigeorgica]|uniref:TetR/AcrR family transcriptional regulator n=1 Tax=Nocardia cyriacigeorgica TaxID=135487 RepID=UPI002453E260|nr:helix-turn-helix domain-containing protein [Nocardia cyriacigeorgica]
MSEQTSHRERKKAATREALRMAATRLFADRGYAATTVREIADQAGVTERTFFRYFAGKEELLVDDIIDDLPVFTAAIRARPGDEKPLTAIERAALAAVERAPDDSGTPSALWLFLQGPPRTQLGRSARSLLVQFESAIADALRDRLHRNGTAPDDVDYTADLAARTAVAVLRTALIREWELRTRDTTNPPDLPALVRQAFALLPALR